MPLMNKSLSTEWTYPFVSTIEFFPYEGPRTGRDDDGYKYLIIISFLRLTFHYKQQSTLKLHFIIYIHSQII